MHETSIVTYTALVWILRAPTCETRRKKGIQLIRMRFNPRCQRCWYADSSTKRLRCEVVEHLILPNLVEARVSPIPFSCGHAIGKDARVLREC